jgi:hypothetical protein
MRRFRRVFTPLVLAVVALAALAPSAGAQTAQRCFAETGFCIEGRIRAFWEQNGGLPVFGYPTGPQQQEQIEGKPILAQWFERNRLELHPENQRPYDVLLGRLGADRLAQQGRDWFTFAKSQPQDSCRYFAETQHNVCGDILAAWRGSGLEFDGTRGKSEAESLALFGMPLSDPLTETLSDGKQYTVQWFERARFELHPENQSPYNILFGLLGNEIRAGTAAAPQPQPPAVPCNDVPDPVNGRIRPGKCLGAGGMLAIDVFGFQPNEQIGFWLNAPDGSVFGSRSTYNIGPSGSVENLPFDTSGLPAGAWSLVFKSSTTDYTAIVYFKVLAA